MRGGDVVGAEAAEVAPAEAVGMEDQDVRLAAGHGCSFAVPAVGLVAVWRCQAEHRWAVDPHPVLTDLTGDGIYREGCAGSLRADAPTREVLGIFQQQISATPASCWVPEDGWHTAPVQPWRVFKDLEHAPGLYRPESLTGTTEL